MPRRYLHRHQPPAAHARWLKAGLGAMITFVLIWLLGDAAGVPLIVAPLGASAVIVFGMPESPLSQPANVLGGHAAAAFLALTVDHLGPGGPITLAVTVGVVIALLGVVRLTHPPAGATALVVLLSHPGWSFLFTPVIAGSVVLVLTAVAVHRLPPKSVYLLPVPEKPPAPPPLRPRSGGDAGKMVFGQVIADPAAGERDG